MSSANNQSVCILMGGSDALRRQVQGVSQRVRLLSPDEVTADSDALKQVEIVYGGIKAEWREQATRLRWLQTSGAGVNGLITPDILASDLIITNASGIHAEPITEHMFAQLLQFIRRLYLAWDQQKVRKWDAGPMRARVGMLSGMTLGVLGVGSIGGHAAKVGQGFDMRVVGLRRTGLPHPHVEHMYAPDERKEFFAQADVIMNSMPLTEKTRGFVGWDEFAAMKSSAIILNTGRGATINTEALMAALREGRLGGALLDVTDPEPLPEDHPLWSMENVHLTPHYAGNHPTYDERAGAIFLDNLERYLEGRPLRNVVDKQEGY